MKAGDIKKFLEKTIDSDNTGSNDPQAFRVNDTNILGLVNAYRKGEGSDHIKKLAEGYLTTERLTVERRCAVLKMVSDVLSGLSGTDKPTDTDKKKLKGLLVAYYV